MKIVIETWGLSVCSDIQKAEGVGWACCVGVHRWLTWAPGRSFTALEQNVYKVPGNVASRGFNYDWLSGRGRPETLGCAIACASASHRMRRIHLTLIDYQHFMSTGYCEVWEMQWRSGQSIPLQRLHECLQPRRPLAKCPHPLFQPQFFRLSPGQFCDNLALGMSFSSVQTKGILSWNYR